MPYTGPKQTGGRNTVSNRAPDLRLSCMNHDARLRMPVRFMSGVGMIESIPPWRRRLPRLHGPWEQKLFKGLLGIASSNGVELEIPTLSGREVPSQGVSLFGN